MIKQRERSLKEFLFDNKVALLFIVLCIGAFFASGQSFAFLTRELFTRISRNTFMVLSLIIPVVTGLGLNFGIVIGAVAAQIGVFTVVYLGYTGMKAIGIILAIALPLAVLFGWLVGTLFNKMKGSEMIGGMVLGYFTDGLYQLLFLFIIGVVIPVDPKSPLIISGGIGVKNSIDLKDNIKYAIDNIPLITVIEIGFFVFLGILLVTLISKVLKKENLELKSLGIKAAIAGVIYGLTYIPFVYNMLKRSRLLLLTAIEIVVLAVVVLEIVKVILAMRKKVKINLPLVIGKIVLALGVFGLTYIDGFYKGLIAVEIPIVTYLLIGGLCLFNAGIMKTRLGQNMRTVGQNRSVATSAGINVNKTRVIAMILSTVLACIAQVISLQNIGTFLTYGAHVQVAQFTIAALLVGGASVHKATNKQAIVGVVLFHTLFILSPNAGKELFGDAQIGEYFRVFVAYGVIAVSLAMHAWKTVKKKGVPVEKEPRESDDNLQRSI